MLWKIKMVRMLNEQGYSSNMIARILDMPETEVKYMVRHD